MATLSGNYPYNGDITAATFTGTGNIEVASSIGSASVPINLTYSGSGTLILAAANNQYSTTIKYGTVQLANPAALGTASPSNPTIFTTINLSGGLDVNGQNIGSTNNISGEGILINSSPYAANIAGTVGLSTQVGEGDIICDGKIAISGRITGAIVKDGPGTLTLSNSEVNPSATTVLDGLLQLDFSASPATSILNALSTIVLNGGNFLVTGTVSGKTSQTVAGLTVASAGSITIDRNGGNGAVLNLGPITRNAGTAINFNLPAGPQSTTNGIITNTTNGPSGIIGGWATVNGTDWAAVNGTGNIVPFSNYSPLPASGGASTGNYEQIGASTLSGSVAVNSLKAFDTGSNQTLAMGANNLIFSNSSGGLLYAGGLTNSFMIGSPNDTGVITTSPSGELLVNAAPFTNLTVNAPIQDNSLTKVTIAGGGTVVLNGVNTFQGGLDLAAGELVVSASYALGSSTNVITVNGGTLGISGTALTSAGFRPIDLFGTLTIDVINASNTFNLLGNVIPYYGGAFHNNSAYFSLKKTGQGILYVPFTPLELVTLAGGTLGVDDSNVLGGPLPGHFFSGLSATVIASSSLYVTANGGTYQVPEVGKISIEANQTLTVIRAPSQPIEVNFAYPITGAAGLTIDYVAELNAQNEYSGGLTINSGTTYGGGGSVFLGQYGTLGGTYGSLTLGGGPFGASLSLEGTFQSVGTLNGSAGSFIRNGATTPATLSTRGGTFTGALQDGSTGTLAFSVLGYTQTLAGANTYTGATTVYGTLNVTGSLSTVTPLWVGGILNLAKTNIASTPAILKLASLTFGPNGIVTTYSDGGIHAKRTVLTLGSLSNVVYAGTYIGTLDLADNDMDLKSGSVATITNQIAEGYNNGGWNGPGGIVSSVAAGDTTHLTALGVIQNNQSGSAVFTAANPFDGTTPGAGDILVKYTYYGDTNLDGLVDGSDYSRIDNGYLTHLTGWQNGDFNYDGVIDGSDYTLIDNAFNTQGAALSSEVAAVAAQLAAAGAANSSVPEPATSGLLVIALSSLLRRRRRSETVAGQFSQL